MLLYPMKAKTFWTKKLVVKLMVLIFIVSSVFAVLQPILSGVKKYEITTNNSTGFVFHKQMILECLPQPGMATTWYAWGRVVVLYIVPMFIITCLYGRIAFHLAKSSSNDQDLQVNEKVLKSRRRVVYMLLIMIIVFGVCWLLMNVFVMIEEIPSAGWFMTTPYFVPYFLTTIMLAYFSCISNPILYSFMSEQYRKEFRKMCCCVSDRSALYSESASTENNGKTAVSTVSKT